jgi:hypothetical protein
LDRNIGLDFGLMEEKNGRFCGVLYGKTSERILCSVAASLRTPGNFGFKPLIRNSRF